MNFFPRNLPRPGISLIVGLVIPLLLSAAGVGLAQTVDTTLWITDGLVKSVVTDGSTIYIGGYFQNVGPNTGRAVAIDATTGAVQRPYPRVQGAVLAVAPDGSGGWYLGGLFTSVRGVPRNNLAQLDADGNLTPWNPNANGSVSSLVVSAGIVYAGGSFTSVGGQPRNRIAALDATTGAATAWDPNANGEVDVLAVSGGTVYAGGGFSNIGGQPRNRIAALDAATSAANAWDPNADNTVRALAVSGGTVYAGGIFTSIGGQPRSRIAALDAVNGATTAWNPDAQSNYNTPCCGIRPPEIDALAVIGSTVYVGGFFTGIGGQLRNSIAAVDVTTGAASAWNPNAGHPNAGPSGAVNVLVVSGGTVYAGGSFTFIGGQPRSTIAALDAATGAATAWDPHTFGGSEVSALAVSGGTVYAGGSFISVGGEARNSIAAFDATTGAATAWDPNASDVVRVLAVSGGTVYAGGSFSSIGGKPRSRIAALDAATGAATDWNPNPHLNAPGGRNLEVDALIVSGGVVYAGGSFTDIGGQSRNNLAALDATTGVATAWDPNVDWPDAIGPYANIYALALSGGTVYAGGSFILVGGQPRNNIAAIDATTGAVTAWNPNAQGPNEATVAALAVDGGRVYAGGFFTSIGGQSRNFIAALDATTGLATAFNPNSNGYIGALAVSGGVVYAGSGPFGFTSIGGRARNNIAALDATTGAATAWNPNAERYGQTEAQVYTLAVSGGTVYAGGDFTSIGGLTQPFIVGFCTGACPGPSSCAGPSVAMTLDFEPNKLNLQSMGHWVTATLEPAPPASPSDIDIASIRLNGSVPVDASAGVSIGDADHDKQPDLTVKFDRAAVELVVPEGDAVSVTVTGTIGQGCFSATDVIQVKRGQVTAPAAGAVVQAGSACDVHWDAPAGIQVESVALLWSSDDGMSWALVANGLPNSGSASWAVPGDVTDQARVAVVLVESSEPNGDDVTGVLGVSGRFQIAAPLGVTLPRAELALHGSVPNPGTSLTISFSLPDAEPASLVAYDVSGRELDRRAVGALGAGRHVVTLGASRTLAPGIYLVHLIRKDRRLVARTVVVR